MDLNTSNLVYEPPPDDLLVYEEDVNFEMGDGFAGDGYTTEGGGFHERSTILVDGGDNFGVSAVAFDTVEELIWMGNQGGHATSYFGADMTKYTSFQVHMAEEIRCIHPMDSGVLFLSPSTLRYQVRRGIPIYTHASPNLSEMQCLIPMKHSMESFLISGHTKKMVEFNLAAGRELRTIDVGEAGCAIMRQHSRYLCCGDPTGEITLRDPISLKVEHKFESHNGCLSDFDVKGNLLVTSGFSNRQGTLAVDPVLFVFDLRMLRSIAPITLLLDPLLLRFMPTFSSRLAVASQTGQLQFVETATLSEPDLSLYQINCDSSAIVTALDVSASSEAVIIGETGGSVHLMSSTRAPTFNQGYSRPTEFADPVEQFTPIAIDDPMAVYASIPMPIISGPLLSDWPEQFIKKIYRRTPSVDPEILRTMKMQGTVGYAPNPNTRKRNQVADGYVNNDRRSADYSRSGSGYEDGSNAITVPKRYRKLDVKFSKAGLDDAEIEQYNRTGLSGLEATLPNTYCNAMLQILFWTPSLRRIMLGHHCILEFCVCCELGFLFHMLSSGAPCHSGNLLRALRSAKEASALRLILSDTSAHDINLISLIQSWNRFILHQMHSELLEFKRKEVKSASFVFRDTDFPIIDQQSHRRKRIKPELTEEIIEDSAKSETAISRLFGSRQTLNFTCNKCSWESDKDATVLVHNLIYPDPKNPFKEMTFAEVMELSMSGSHMTPAWCDACHKFQPTVLDRQIRSLPQILSLNCGNINESDRQFWKAQTEAIIQKILKSSQEPSANGSVKQCRYGAACTRFGCRFKHPASSSGKDASGASVHLYQSHSWVPMSLSVRITVNGKVKVSKIGDEGKEENVVGDPVIYDLYGVVCFINEEKKTVISIIDIDVGQGGSQWFIFNDFSITPVAAQEAVWFSTDWKIPCVFYWRQRGAESSRSLAESSIPVPAISYDVMLGQPKCSSIMPLTDQEIPKKGDLVAIDAEFVTLNQEESELRSDGKLATVKPSHMSVARISCVRGQGPFEGMPFIDDYISTQEQVFDYLTKFSGIKPGDLDATCSSKNLTTLKSTYLKLRYLIDNGVIFVGHGLNNDFRVINLVVPPEQIIDTVQLFNLPHHRMISLKFLAWHFTGMKIQEGNHDSVEDSRAALKLYKKYVELENSGRLREALEELYLTGKSLGWKVPSS